MGLQTHDRNGIIKKVEIWGIRIRYVALRYHSLVSPAVMPCLTDKLHKFGTKRKKKFQSPSNYTNLSLNKNFISKILMMLRYYCCRLTKPTITITTAAIGLLRLLHIGLALYFSRHGPYGIESNNPLLKSQCKKREDL